MIRFYNARVLTMAEGNKIEFGEVWTEEEPPPHRQNRREANRVEFLALYSLL